MPSCRKADPWKVSYGWKEYIDERRLHGSTGLMLSTLAMLLLAATPVGNDGRCSLLYPVAPDEAAARRIATAVIASWPTDGSVRPLWPARPDSDPSATLPYTLDVSLSEYFPDRWVVDVWRTPVTLLDGTVVEAGSPSLAMEIDRCSGAVVEFGIAF